jgi:hypothetical protein
MTPPDIPLWNVAARDPPSRTRPFCHDRVMSAAAPAPTRDRARRWLLAAMCGVGLLSLAFSGVNLWESSYGEGLSLGTLALVLAVFCIGRLRAGSASPLLPSAAVGVLSLGLLSFAVWAREDHLEYRRIAAARDAAFQANEVQLALKRDEMAATRREMAASIDEFEAQTRAMMAEQSAEFQALQRSADEWDKAKRERLRELEVQFVERVWDAEQMLSRHRRVLHDVTVRASQQEQK